MIKISVYNRNRKAPIKSKKANKNIIFYLLLNAVNIGFTKSK